MSDPLSPDTIALGGTDLRIRPLGVGTWQWGDGYWWGYGRSYGEDQVQAAFEVSRSLGVTLFDTAEIYGWGRSERLLGRFARQREPVVLASKFMPFPWRLRRQALLSALRASLRRLAVERVDLYQVHWPLPPVSVETWMDGMADAFEAGLIGAVGVSNYSVDQMRRAHERLSRRGLTLASNQVAYSLLNRQPERNGLLAACRELNVTLIAYSPLAMGALSGKYTAQRPPPGPRRGRYGPGTMARIQPLIALLREIGAGHGDKSPAQVAINWVICNGAVPIPGAKDEGQARANAEALGWRLNESEMAALDSISREVERKS